MQQLHEERLSETVNPEEGNDFTMNFLNEMAELLLQLSNNPLKEAIKRYHPEKRVNRAIYLSQYHGKKGISSVIITNNMV